MMMMMMEKIPRAVRGGIGPPRGIGTLDGIHPDEGAVAAPLERTDIDQVVGIVGLDRGRSGTGDRVEIDIVGGLETGIIILPVQRMSGAGRIVESIGGE